MAKLNHALLYGNYEDVFNTMKDAQVGRLVRAMLHYLNTGEELPLKETDSAIWCLMKDQLQRNMDKYDEVCKRNRKNSKKYWDSQKGADSEEEEAEPEAEVPKPLGNSTVSAADAQALYRLREQKQARGIL